MMEMDVSVSYLRTKMLFFLCSRRMSKFEYELFHTVDSILLLLGQKPSIRHKQCVENDVNIVTSLYIPSPRKGARLVKSPTELAKLLDKM